MSGWVKRRRRSRHRWAEWREKLTVWGEFYGYAERRCLDCPVTQTEAIPTYCEKFRG